MKKTIISLMVLSCLVGCGAKIEKQNKVSAERQEANNKSANSLSGKWLWQAKKDGKVISIGGFELAEKNGKVTGASKTLITGLKALPGRGGNERASAAVIVYALDGTKQHNKFNFKVQDNNKTMVKSEATIATDGLSMQGKSRQEVSKEVAQNAGLEKALTLEYEWMAIKVK